MRCLKLVVLSAVLFSCLPAAQAAEIPPAAQRTAWFRQARFGMFIHWGIYSLIGKGEWVRHTGQIPLEEYDKLAAKFNPVDFDAAAWVATAKKTGQKYLAITTKHHDGFCMFDSKLTDFDIRSTPFKRDVIKEIADECHRQGVRLALYYSIMDWHHPDYLPRRPWEKNRSTEGADFDRYLEYMRGQIRELLTNYGTIDTLWFDGGWEHKSPEDLQKLQAIIDMARQIQPNILVNNRAFTGGDFETPEQMIPATGLVDAEGRPVVWEACMTMTTGHGSFAPTAWWGYDREETVFKPTEELVQKLVDVASKGGNLLLNIGPTPEGRIRPEEAERLEGIGRWMAKYGEAIYGTSASPFRLLPFFGRVTQKENRLFVHVFDWPQDRRLELPGLKTGVTRAYLMDSPANTLKTSAGAAALVIELSAKASDPVASVVAVELAAPAQVEAFTIRPDSQGVVDLPATYADIQAKHGQRAKLMSEHGRAYIGNWSNPNDVVVWQFDLPAEGSYRIEIDARPASQEAIGQRVRVTAGSENLVAKIDAKGISIERPVKLAAGPATLSVELLDAKRTGPSTLDLQGVRVVPAK